MKKILAVLLAIALVLSIAPVSLAATSEATAAANALNKLGLFNGTGVNPDGSPRFELDRAPTRHDSVTMLVRLLGKENEAKNTNLPHPYKDVASWASPYVGYAHKNGLTNGMSPTSFGGQRAVTAPQYVTFILRALGYKDNVDFVWSNPFALSDSLGITKGKYNKNSNFTRGDVAFTSNNALSVKMKGSSKTLLDTLIEAGAVQEPFDETKVISQLATTEYTRSGSYYNYAFLTVKNNSVFDLEINVDATFYKAGKVVGAKQKSESAFEHGQEILLTFLLDEEFDDVDYEISVEEEPYYTCVWSGLSYEGTIAKDKVVLSVTNNGENPAEFVEAYLLFFLGDTVVGYDSTYFTDDDFELKPGKSMKRELNCFEEFDTYQVFLTGRYSK